MTSVGPKNNLDVQLTEMEKHLQPLQGKGFGKLVQQIKVGWEKIVRRVQEGKWLTKQEAGAEKLDKLFEDLKTKYINTKEHFKDYAAKEDKFLLGLGPDAKNGKFELAKEKTFKEIAEFKDTSKALEQQLKQMQRIMGLVHRHDASKSKESKVLIESLDTKIDELLNLCTEEAREGVVKKLKMGGVGEYQPGAKAKAKEVQPPEFGANQEKEIKKAVKNEFVNIKNMILKKEAPGKLTKAEFQEQIAKTHGKDHLQIKFPKKKKEPGVEKEVEAEVKVQKEVVVDAKRDEFIRRLNNFIERIESPKSTKIRLQIQEGKNIIKEFYGDKKIPEDLFDNIDKIYENYRQL